MTTLTAYVTITLLTTHLFVKSSGERQPFTVDLSVTVAKVREKHKSKLTSHAQNVMKIDPNRFDPVPAEGVVALRNTSHRRIESAQRFKMTAYCAV
jgi:hypothetical protein